MGLRQLRRHLPGPLGQQWRERARRQRATEDADRLAGRLRYATLQGLEGAARTWARDVAGTWRSLAEAMAAAVERNERAAARERRLFNNLHGHAVLRTTDGRARQAY